MHPSQEERTMFLSDCIRNDVVTASPEDSVEDIARLMDRRNVEALLSPAINAR
jgi:CBS domain-containing protein